MNVTYKDRQDLANALEAVATIIRHKEDNECAAMRQLAKHLRTLIGDTTDFDLVDDAYRHIIVNVIRTRRKHNDMETE